MTCEAFGSIPDALCEHAYGARGPQMADLKRRE